MLFLFFKAQRAIHLQPLLIYAEGAAVVELRLDFHAVDRAEDPFRHNIES